MPVKPRNGDHAHNEPLLLAREDAVDLGRGSFPERESEGLRTGIGARGGRGNRSGTGARTGIPAFGFRFSHCGTGGR